MERLALDRCQQMLGLVIAGKKDPSSYCRALQKLEAVVDRASIVSLDLVEGVRNLEKAVLEADVDAMVSETTTELLERLMDRYSSSTLSMTMFASPHPKLSRKQQELANWLAPSFRLDVTPKESWLRDVESSVVAIRWLSFRADLRKEPNPLVKLANAVASCQSQKRKRRKVESDDEAETEGEEMGGHERRKSRKNGAFEKEEVHYDLMEAFCKHAASGQLGIDLKRLRRKKNDGEDISVIMGDIISGLEMKRFLNKEIQGTSLQKVMALAEEISQLLYYLLRCDQWSGRQAGALIFAHLLFAIDVTFMAGKVEQMTVAPGFPTFCGSKEPLLELYDRKRLYGREGADPDFVFAPAPSDGFKGLVKLVKHMCVTNGVAVTPLRFVTYEGRKLEVVVGEQLVYSGRNSVVLSCRAHDADQASSVIKVAPASDSTREQGYHRELDKVPGVRDSESSGYVEGAGTDLHFIQLAHYGNPFRASHVAGGRGREFAEQACRTLEEMHKLKVLHRDVKPGNFIVVGDATLFLNDFDLSCDMEDEFQRHFVAGTPLFRSPRLSHDGEEAYDMVDDWMSLGLTFMYLLGPHRSEGTKVSALRKIATADWAPDALKSNVADGLQRMEQQRMAGEPVEKTEVEPVEASGLRRSRRSNIKKKSYNDESDSEIEAEDESEEEAETAR